MSAAINEIVSTLKARIMPGFGMRDFGFGVRTGGLGWCASKLLLDFGSFQGLAGTGLVGALMKIASENALANGLLRLLHDHGNSMRLGTTCPPQDTEADIPEAAR